MERLQDRVLRAMRLTPESSGQNGNSPMILSDWSPAVDITEDDKEYLITAELPEIEKDAVKITVENGTLSIRGERRREAESKNKKVHRIERSYGSFVRTFNLPEDADPNGVSASFREGVLRVSLAKSEEKKPRQIEVKVE